MARDTAHRAQAEGHGDADQSKPPANFVPMQQAGKIIPYHLARRCRSRRRLV
jgi:hypothetical protein